MTYTVCGGTLNLTLSIFILNDNLLSFTGFNGENLFVPVKIVQTDFTFKLF